MSSLSPKGCKPVATPVPVRTPVHIHVPAGVSEDPDTTNRGDNEGIVTFAESRPTVISTVQQQPVNTGGDEHKVELSRFASMFPPQPTIGHDVPLKESDSSNEGEISNGEESEKPEQDRSPESKHEGAGNDVLSSSFETTEEKKSEPNAETECVSSESPATELSDMEDDSANRGEKDNRFAQSSDQEKRDAIREIESTLEDAKKNADFIKTQSPAWYDRFECKKPECKMGYTKCCYLAWMNKEGKNAGKGPSKQAVDSILPTVRDIAKGVTASLTWCTHHGCLNHATGKCNKQCESNKIYMAHSPVHGAMLIAGACKRPASTKTDKEFYKEHRCCSIQDSQGNTDSRTKCCYEMYQSGDRKGPNIQHHLEMNTASVTRNAMNPAFEAAKAEIEAGSSSEEIAKAILGEYEKANEQFTLSRRNKVLEEKTSREAAGKAAAGKAAADKAAAAKAAEAAAAEAAAADKAAADNAVEAALVVRLAKAKAVSDRVREELKYHNMDHRKRYLCSYYDEGKCWHSESEDCEDAHGEEELRLYQQAWFDTKTKLESQLEKCRSVI